jgi:hypothetical protein
VERRRVLRLAFCAEAVVPAADPDVDPDTVELLPAIGTRFHTESPINNSFLYYIYPFTYEQRNYI